jgi:hypothetical protein
LKKKKDSIGSLRTNSDINCPQIKENLIEKVLHSILKLVHILIPPVTNSVIFVIKVELGQIASK